MPDIEDAIELACQAHRGQTDKGGAAYILHPLRVMAAMHTDQERIVAVLHDAVEDSPLTVAEVGSRFGDRIAAAVEALTKKPHEPYKEYVARVKADELARKVKIADLRDNSDFSRLGRAPTEEDRRRLDKYLWARATLTS